MLWNYLLILYANREIVRFQLNRKLAVFEMRRVGVRITNKRFDDAWTVNILSINEFNDYLSQMKHSTGQLNVFTYSKTPE